MNELLEKFLDQIKDDSGSLAKGELTNFIDMAKNDNDNFIKEQGNKMETYLTQLATGNITKENFESYILDLKDLSEMQMLKMTVAAKASAQRLVDGISKLILDGLVKLL